MKRGFECWLGIIMIHRGEYHYDTKGGIIIMIHRGIHFPGAPEKGAPVHLFDLGNYWGIGEQDRTPTPSYMPTHTECVLSMIDGSKIFRKRK